MTVAPGGAFSALVDSRPEGARPQLQAKIAFSSAFNPGETRGSMLILHLSDLHFGTHSRFKGEDLAKLGKAFFKDLNAARGSFAKGSRIDFVAVTGDIAESGKPHGIQGRGALPRRARGRVGARPPPLRLRARNGNVPSRWRQGRGSKTRVGRRPAPSCIRRLRCSPHACGTIIESVSLAVLREPAPVISFGGVPSWPLRR